VAEAAKAKDAHSQWETGMSRILSDPYDFETVIQALEECSNHYPVFQHLVDTWGALACIETIICIAQSE
jgi:hypothetical protein